MLPTNKSRTSRSSESLFLGSSRQEYALTVVLACHPIADCLVLRAEHKLSTGLCKKVASFCNVMPDCVVQSLDVPSIYEVPIKMQEQGLDAAILRLTGEEVGETPEMKPWRTFVERRNNAKKVINIEIGRAHV